MITKSSFETFHKIYHAQKNKQMLYMDENEYGWMYFIINEEKMHGDW